MPVTAIADLLDGDRLALSRILTEVENHSPSGTEALNELFPYTGNAHVIGVTGAPGTGKSTLVNRLAYHYRHPPKNLDPVTIGVVAVDPSSPFSGGAVLGDRIRMRDLAGDPGVFIRSMATRGSLGGLARATAGMVQVFDAAGFDLVLVETVGAGQAEVDIASLAHTTIVLEAPGMGDDVQTIKAGILEIADILVVNKFDRTGAKNTLRTLRNMLRLVDPGERTILHHQAQSSPFPDPPADTPEERDNTWEPPLVTTVATSGDGIPDLVEKIQEHHAYLHRSGMWTVKEQRRLKAEMDNLLQDRLVSRWKASITTTLYQETLQKLVNRELSPYQAVPILLEGGPKV